MDRAIARAVTDKKPVPEIDFTLHTMEDNTQVSTMERVVKGKGCRGLSRFHKMWCLIELLTVFDALRGPSPRHQLPSG